MTRTTQTLDVLFVRVPPWLSVENPHPENCEAPLDLGVAMALVERDGHRVHFCDIETRRHSVDGACRLAERVRTDVVVLSGITPSHASMMTVAAAARRTDRERLIVACGQHATSVPESFLFNGSPFDLCAIGEFETTLRDVIRAAACGGDTHVAGTASWSGAEVRTHGDRGLIGDLDSLPHPLHRFFMDEAYAFFYPMTVKRRQRWGFVIATRGCPYPCIYCTAALRTSFGAEVRRLSPENVVGEIRHLKALGINVLVFRDDTINLDRDYLRDLCRCMIDSKVGITWTAQGRVDLVDETTLALMKRAGCCTIGFGVECGSPRVLEVLRKRSTVRDAEAAFAAARRAGLMTVAFFMLGSPGETEEELEMTAALMKHLKPNMIQVAFFTAYPGSPHYQETGEKRTTRWNEYSHYNRLNNVSSVTDRRLRQFQARLYRDLLFSSWFVPEYLRRRNVGLLSNLGREWQLARFGLKFLLHGPKPVR
ncbi:MAG: B12-binding domain-containing radical SAM protein [Deltaproteobacteria bacterium]|nr:B12-binding domain-containing radical SAM protein [Deltaproteobacteria bacterium]